MKFSLSVLCFVFFAVPCIAEQPVMRECHCSECHCTPEKNCGCYSEKGCPCTQGQTCGANIPG